MKSNARVSYVLTFFFVFAAFAIVRPQGPETPAVALPKSTSKVNVKYDKSKDTTAVSLKSMTISSGDQEKRLTSKLPAHQMEFEAFFSYKGQTPGQPVQEVVLRFRCVANTYIFLKGQELIVAIDREIAGKDRGFSLGMTDYKSLAPKFNTVFEEVMELRVPADALRKFASAETLEYFFGPVPYRFTPKQQGGFKEMASLLSAPAPAK